jgi:hypothetical protein
MALNTPAREAGRWRTPVIDSHTVDLQAAGE